MIDLEFVPMQLDHVPEIMAIEKASYTTPWSRTAYIQELMENDMANYLVALERGKVIGYCGFWLIIDEAHITTIAVHPSYRGQQIGTSLLAGIIAIAKLKGAKAMTLEVRKSNSVAKSLYAKFGFVPAGLRKAYYADNKEDAIIMWKEDMS